MAKHGKVKKFAKQHFVPQCYTKPWCDASAPAGPNVTPYGWQFDRDGGNPRRRAPINLFTETDIYTIPLPGGERDLRLEHGLQEFEDKFTRIRNIKLAPRPPLDDEDIAWLQGFVATAHARTAAYRNFHQKQWANIRRRLEEADASYKAATPQQRQAMQRMSTLGDKREKGMTIEDIRRLETHPIQEMIGLTLRTVLPIYARMSIAILCTDDPLGFVTTDDPVTWYNPNAYKLPPLYRAPGLGMRDIEVTLPVSPRQCLVISHHHDFSGYMDVNRHTVDQLNVRHIAHCESSYIACKNELRSMWFEHPEMPEDAWEKVREKKLAAGE